MILHFWFLLTDAHFVKVCGHELLVDSEIGAEINYI